MPGWFATPFLQDSFIPYSMPVYPGALCHHLAPLASKAYQDFLALWKDADPDSRLRLDYACR